MPSSAFLEHIFGPHSPDVDCVLLEISHPGLESPIRVTSNGEDITSNAVTYLHYPFRIELPGDTEGAPIAKLAIANVDRSIGAAVDAITTHPSVTIRLVLASSPDVIEYEWAGLEMRNVVRTALDVQADIVQSDFEREPWPNIRVREGNFPNLYR